jgi:hypothetical protein
MRVRRATSRARFVERSGMLGALNGWCGRVQVHVAVELYDALGIDVTFMVMSNLPAVVIKLVDPSLSSRTGRLDPS